MRNQPHKPTSADIAMLAGVSRSTVSRVINGYANVPEETCRRVMAVIEQQGYYPSMSGQTLRGKRTRCVGVFLGDSGWRDEIQAMMLYSFSKAAQALGYMTLSGRVGAFDTPACDKTVREVLNSGYVDAGVFFNARGGNAYISRLLSEGQTVGALCYQPDTSERRLFTVGMDMSVVEQVMGYALSLGHRRMALLCDPHSHNDCQTVGELFRLAASTHRDMVEYRQSDALAPVERQAADAMDAQAMPVLLICTDHASIFAAYRAAYARGLTVGSDVSILGVGVLPTNLPVCPPLCGFCFDPGEMVTSLAERLIRTLEGEPDAPRHYSMKHQFVQGESCKRALEIAG